jgi:hypothetical protein
MACPTPPVGEMAVCTAGGACSTACATNYTSCNGGCYLTTPDQSVGIFVAPGGGSTSCGSEAAPCGTIAAGLAAVASSLGTKNILYIANATYTEQVTLPAGVTLQGGWLDTGGTWTRPCVTNPQANTIILAPAGDSTTVIANFSSAGTSTLDTLTVQSIPTAAAGQSLYGIMATGTNTNLTLNDVSIDVAAGGAGTAGTTGMPGTMGTGNCTTPATTVTNGMPGTPGTAAGNGTYSASGFTPAIATAGGLGGTGSNGVMGAPGVTTMIDNKCVADPNTGCSEVDPDPCTSGPGNCGVGGTGGLGGSQGTGGGASIGVFAWGATVTITSGSITPGPGGVGGSGGAGGMMGQGGQGAPGANGTYPVGCASHCTVHGTFETCTCLGGTQEVCAMGGAGSLGGNGGMGGQGGGGAGGDSWCWYQGNGAVVTSTAQCTPQTAGARGGTMGGGATGLYGVHN